MYKIPGPVGPQGPSGERGLLDQGGDVGVTGKKIDLKVRIRLYYYYYNDLLHY